MNPTSPALAGADNGLPLFFAFLVVVFVGGIAGICALWRLLGDAYGRDPHEARERELAEPEPVAYWWRHGLYHPACLVLSRTDADATSRDDVPEPVASIALDMTAECTRCGEVIR